MKKLQLNLTKITGAITLTRDQLKDIMGGESPFTTEPSNQCWTCICDDGSASWADCEPLGPADICTYFSNKCPDAFSCDPGVQCN